MSKTYKLRGYATRLSNKARRSDMDVKVFSLKIDSSKLSKKKFAALERLFLEAKWLYNNLLENNFRFDTKAKTVEVRIFNPASQKLDIVENRPLTMPAQLKQAVKRRAVQNCINLAAAKKKGLKIGQLNFTPEVNSIPLNQAGVTYRVSKNFVELPKIGKLRVNGTEQVIGKKMVAAEMANATLIRKPSGFYINITVYIPKDTQPKEGSIGLDFGIKNSITLSDGRTFNAQVEIPKNLRREQRRRSRKIKGSHNYVKSYRKINRIYERLSNRKSDLSNKFVASLRGYEHIYFQDENLAGWKKLFGRKVQNGVLGRIKAKLKSLETAKMLDRYLPTTKFSPISYKNVDTPLSSRLFRDGDFEMDRDVKAAKTILALGSFNPKITREELMGLPVEHLASIFAAFGGDKQFAMNQEATAL